MIGADVGCGAFAFDMLFARRECEDVGALPAIINGLADESPRHLVDVLLARREKADAWSAKPKRNPQRLPVTDDDIRAHIARRLEHRERSRIRNDANQRALRMCVFDKFCVIVYASEEIGILEDEETGIVGD